MTQRRVTTRAELLADIERSWAALNAALDRLTDADRLKPYRHSLPDEPGAGDWPAINVIYGNTAHHFTNCRQKLWTEKVSRRNLSADFQD